MIQPEALELFAGFGGVAIALKNLGVSVTAAVEREARPAEVYQCNHPGTPVHVAAVGDVDYTPYRGVYLMHGSPPCQNFSQARDSNLPPHADADAGLEMIRAAAECRPRLITLENVQGYKVSPVFAEICTELAKLGYVAIVHPTTQDHCVYSWDKLGGPQARKRLFARWVHQDYLDDLPITAIDRNLFGVSKCWGQDLEPIPHPTAGWYAAIADLLDAMPDGSLAPWQERALIKGGWLSEEGDRRLVGKMQHSTKALLVPRVGGRTDENGALKNIRTSDLPAPTIKALGHDQHYRQLDAILENASVKCLDTRCFARLQGFPDWFELPTAGYVAGKGIGNAVPPPMYEAIAGPMLRAIV